MPDPGDISQAIKNFIPTGMFDQFITFIGYALMVVIIFAFFAIIYYFIVFKYKVTYPVLHYNDEHKQSAQIIGYKHDRACDKRTKGGVKKQWLFFKRKLIEPFKEADIKPGNKVPLLKINDDGTYITMPNLTFSNPIEAFEQLTPEEKFWGVLQLQENAKTFQSDEGHKRAILLTIGTIVLCLIITGVTVWLSVKAPGQIAGSFDAWGQQFLSVAQSMGGVPPG